MFVIIWKFGQFMLKKFYIKNSQIFWYNKYTNKMYLKKVEKKNYPIFQMVLIYTFFDQSYSKL